MPLTAELSRKLYADMWRIRLFEEEALRQTSLGSVKGALHMYCGEEAVAVGGLRPSARRRLRARHPSQPRPLSGEGRADGTHDGRALRPHHRQLPRQGRVDAHRRLLEKHPRRQRDRRGRHRPGDRYRAREQDPRHRPGFSGVLRRRRGGPRPIPRRDSVRLAVDAAGGVRLREQPVPAVGSPQERRGGGLGRGHGRVLRHSRHISGRAGLGGGPRRGGRGDRVGPGRAAARR